MSDHVDNRTKIADALHRELVGPEPSGPEIDVDVELEYGDYLEADGPWRQRPTGDEILTRDAPVKRYGMGVLFPLRVPLEEISTRDEGASEAEEGKGGEEDAPDPPEIEVPGSGNINATEDDFDLSLANAYQPSSLGLSFLAGIGPDSTVVVEVGGGRYRRKVVTIRRGEEAPRTREWWLRTAARARAAFSAQDLSRARPTRLTARNGDERFDGENIDGLDLRVEILSRPWGDGRALLTVCVVGSTGFRVGTDPALRSESRWRF